MTTDHIETAKTAGRVAVELAVRSKVAACGYSKYERPATLTPTAVKKLVSFYESLIEEDVAPAA